MFMYRDTYIQTGLNSPGLEPRWTQEILLCPHPSRPSRQALGPTQPPLQWLPGLLPGCKATRECPDSPTPISAHVKNE
jgi:hypothetical protein